MPWIYVGDGEFIPGVPARDLTDKEVKEMDVEAQVDASELYKKESGRAKKPDGGNK